MTVFEWRSDDPEWVYVDGRPLLIHQLDEERNNK